MINMPCSVLCFDTDTVLMQGQTSTFEYVVERSAWRLQGYLQRNIQLPAGNWSLKSALCVLNCPCWTIYPWTQCRSGSSAAGREYGYYPQYWKPYKICVTCALQTQVIFPPLCLNKDHRKTCLSCPCLLFTGCGHETEEGLDSFYVFLYCTFFIPNSVNLIISWVVMEALVGMDHLSLKMGCYGVVCRMNIH